MCRPIPKNQRSAAGATPPQTLKRKATGHMATKTKSIEVKVDERLAAAIEGKGVHSWHATSYSNGRKRVYVTFEEVVSA